MSNIIDKIQVSGVTYDIGGSGGGKAVSGGTNISITTGETADTINCTLPITTSNNNRCIITGTEGTKGSAEGMGTYESFITGRENKATNYAEAAFGRYNRSNYESNTFGNSGNTLFSVGNGTGSFTSDRHNAFEIRQNGDIYLSSGGTDIKLQDHLGGGGGGGISSAECQTMIDENISGKTDNTTFTAYTASTDTAIQGKQDTLVSGTNIKTINNESILGSGNITIQGGGGGNPTVELTQAEYDALVTAGTVSADTFYVITDAQGGDLSNYWTTAQTQSAITQATSGLQETLVSGTNIKTINNQSLLGSGNIDIQGGGGGKAIEAGRGISVTTGETADTVSFNLPISAGTGENSIVGNIAQNTASGKNALALGGFYNSQFSYGLSVASGLGSVSFGGNASGEQSFAAASIGCTASGQRSATIAGYSNESKGIESLTSGRYVNAENMWECSFGYANVSHKANNTWGNSGNTLFSVGNGTANNARHNAFEIRQNGDIYCSDGTNDVKLQDYLQVKVVKLTQSAYNALSPNYDSNTLYIIKD